MSQSSSIMLWETPFVPTCFVIIAWRRHRLNLPSSVFPSTPPVVSSPSSGPSDCSSCVSWRLAEAFEFVPSRPIPGSCVLSLVSVSPVWGLCSCSSGWVWTGRGVRQRTRFLGRVHRSCWDPDRRCCSSRRHWPMVRGRGSLSWLLDLACKEKSVKVQDW